LLFDVPQGEGAQAIITADPNLDLIYAMLSSDGEVKVAGAAILANVAAHGELFLFTLIITD
jgi:hypothetical protein